MEYLIVNLKEALPSADVAVANMEIEIENATKAHVKAIKFIHGYGSHGKGGIICNQARRRLIELKKQNKISEIILGNEWNLNESKTLKLLYCCPSAALDEDLNHYNFGVTIVVLNSRC